MQRHAHPVTSLRPLSPLTVLVRTVGHSWGAQSSETLLIALLSQLTKDLLSLSAVKCETQSHTAHTHSQQMHRGISTALCPHWSPPHFFTVQLSVMSELLHMLVTLPSLHAPLLLLKSHSALKNNQYLLPKARSCTESCCLL